ncbi:serine hydrolase domain-containing protein [Planococcus sp. CAU13]|uniref:serine hydrolase domain-containing protein n=1 Tax=Planococcus sp. CAU13 TaxID=1541197 RepID=UPI00052FE7EA|nr:serine hydrolase domain-containing protein [Planococcus sp. CAU13]
MFSAIEKQINEQMVSQSIPGFSMAIVQGQEVVYSKGFGVTNKEEGGIPVTENTLFRIGSLSKPLTATAIMVLVDQGILNLDIPIKEYVPFFTLKDQAASNKITLRMLLSHTAGLPDGTDIVGSRNLDALKYYIQNDVPQLSLIAPPGLIFSYSNHGFNIAGYVAEFVTEKYFPEFMQEVLFNPIGMSRTVYDPLLAMTFPVALGHERTEKGEKVVRPFYENVANYPSWFAMSTAEDYAKFLLMHLNAGQLGNQSLLSASAVNEMQKLQVSRYNLHQLGCGLSFITEEYNGVQTLRHGGAIGTYTSFILAAPEKKMAIVTMSNQDYGIDLAYDIMDKLLEVDPIHIQPKSMTPNSLIWKQYTGYYLGNLNGLAHIFIDGQQLKMQLNGKEMTLHAYEENLYFAKDTEGNPIATVGFVLGERDEVDYIVLDGQFCKRVEKELISQPRTSESSLEGTYSNGSVSYGLKVIKDQLFMLDEDQQLFCQPLFGNFFYTEEQGLLEIQEIEKRKILIIQDNWKFEKVGR